MAILTTAVVVAGLTVLIAYMSDMDRPWEVRTAGLCWLSYLFAFLLTFLFSVCVCLSVKPKPKTIGSIPTGKETMKAVVYDAHGPPSVLKVNTIDTYISDTLE